MKTMPSEFFQPILANRQEPLAKQLATEYFIDELEKILSSKAEEMATTNYSARKLKVVARFLENLVLRHPDPASWLETLAHEIERKKNEPEQFLRDVLAWSKTQDKLVTANQPEAMINNLVAKGLDAAKTSYTYAKKEWPLTEAEMASLGKKVHTAALRDFLSRLLGRLTE